ncbi:MAG: Antitoxin VapB [Marmoricola sp.]|nr:Antitoxin VapB [Marmoricola sp.]
MNVATTKLFMNNTTQAVRLPKDVAFPDDVSEVEIIVSGNARVIVPKGGRIEYYLANRVPAPDDFMLERDQPPMQERSWLD